jgi:hypothetical protein
MSKFAEGTRECHEKILVGQLGRHSNPASDEYESRALPPGQNAPSLRLKNLNVHHLVHKSSPLSKVNSVHTLTS